MFRIACSFAIVLLASPVAADSAIEERAAKLFDEGRAFSETGAWNMACQRFQASLDLVESDGAKINLADCLHKQDYLWRAWQLFNELANKPATNAARRKVARERRAIIEAKLAVVVLELADPGAPALGITINGREIEPADEIRELVDPGSIAIEAFSPEGRFATKLEVKRGETGRVEIPRIARATPERRSWTPAHLELFTVSAVASIYTTTALCSNVDCNRPETAVLYPLGLGIPMAITTALSFRDLRTEKAQLFNSVQAWGAWNAAGYADAYGSSGDTTPLIVGEALALGVGVGLWFTPSLQMSSGDIALVNTFWVWGSAIAAIGSLPYDARFSDIVIAGDLALAAGLVVASQVEISRLRATYIDGFGALGAIAGAFGAAASDASTNTSAAWLVGSTVSGLALGVVLTRNTDSRDSNLRIAPAHIGDWGVAAGIEF